MTSPGGCLRNRSRTIVFRFDASPSIGHGHAGRCLALAAALRQRCCRVVLVAAGLTGVLRARASVLGCDFHDLDSPLASTVPTLTEFERDDAERTVAICESYRIEPSWIVVDGYHFGELWHTITKSLDARLLCIDDLANRPLRCEALVDQNLVCGLERRYDGLVSASCRTFLGPKYALLAPEYAALRLNQEPKGKTKRILVSFGGADPINATEAAVNAVAELDEPDIEADVVISNGHRCFPAVQCVASRDSRINLHQPLPTLAPLLARASVAVGGAGATSWERLCMNVPSIAIPLADNQRPIALGLAAHGLAVVINPDAPDLTGRLKSALRNTLAEVCSMPPRHEPTLVDGEGAARVADHMVLSCSM
jgi:UDP-2,4-diacetamido-2,4,6-trideoxy-beta-L-altropyranose hydrolase